MTTGNKILHSTIIGGAAGLIALFATLLDRGPSLGAEDWTMAVLFAFLTYSAVWLAMYAVVLPFISIQYPWLFDGSNDDYGDPEAQPADPPKPAPAAPAAAATKAEYSRPMERAIIGHKVLTADSPIFRHDAALKAARSAGQLDRITLRLLDNIGISRTINHPDTEAHLLKAALLEGEYIDEQGEWTGKGIRAYPSPTDVAPQNIAPPPPHHHHTTTTTGHHRPIYASGGGD